MRPRLRYRAVAHGRLALSAIAFFPATLPLHAQDVAGARTALQSGDYRKAIAAWSQLVAAGEDYPESTRALVDAYAEVGRYREAEATAREAIAAHPGSPEVWNRLGEVLQRRGALDSAEDAFARAIAGGASDRLQAELNLALVRLARGDREDAFAGFDRFIDVYNRGDARTSAQLTAVATAVSHLGAENPDLFQDAKRAYEQAIAADTLAIAPRILLGDLFLAKFNSRDASELFAEALAINPRHPDALLGMARRMHFDNSGAAYALARRGLETNPHHVPTRAFLARLYLDQEDFETAAVQADSALAVDPTSVEALAMLGAARYLRGDSAGFRHARDRALAVNPRAAGFYTTVAEIMVRNRLYAQAVELAQQAVELEARSWRALAVLGTNQLRTGAMAEGRRNLETSFAGDPYNLWVKNTLDLLDTLEGFPETRSERFRFYIDGRESELLTLYLGELAEEAYARLSDRYDYRPATPVRLEVYGSHADFSVRTMGLAGLAALGVAFGNVLAMDSPTAHDPGHFSWGSTFWHELSHTMTLGVTGHRIPRWFTEGLAVYDERLARPGWGYELSPGFLLAFKAGRLLPIEELNAGFVRPTYPNQVLYSYYQASLVCEMIDTEEGWTAILAMLDGYREGLSTGQLLREVLGQSPSAFDAAFDAFLRQKFATALRSLPEVEPAADAESPPTVSAALDPADTTDFGSQLTAGRERYENGDYTAAVAFLERAKRLFPEYAGAGSPYWYLAQSYRATGRPQLAIAELRQLTARNAADYEANLELAQLLEAAGDPAGAAAALEQAMYVYPLELAAHETLAGLFARTGEHDRAVRERRAVLALRPVDRAEALYQLALAYYDAGDPAEARRAVLRALEDAPHFEKAQELLLKLHDGATDSASETGIDPAAAEGET